MTDTDSDQDKSSIVTRTGYKPYDPNKIVTSYSEAKRCECTIKTETNWEHVEKVVKRFKFVDNNPFGKSQNKSWAIPPPDNSIILRTCSSKEKIDEEDQEIQLRKCTPNVYLAGSYESLGFSQFGSEKPCNQMKCTKCNNKVESFDNYSWTSLSTLSSTQYRLFLEENMPEFDQVCSKLEKSKGGRAYACHCSHLNVDKLTTLNSHPEVSHNWICGKHSVVVQLKRE